MTASRSLAVLALSGLVLLACGRLQFGSEDAGRDARTLRDATPRDAGHDGADADPDDGGERVDAPGDGDADGDDGASSLPPPAALWPWNGTPTSSSPAADPLRPVFAWTSAGAGLTHELEIDDSCAAGSFATCDFSSPEVRVATSEVTYQPPGPLAIDASPPVGRRYYWRVRACDGAACSTWSAVRYVELGRLADDFNGDGCSDIAVGGPGLATDGAIYVYYGRPSFDGTEPPTVLLEPVPGSAGRFAERAAAVGDLNGDGYSELAVTSPDLTGAGGRVYLYAGGPSGLPLLPTLELAPGTPDGFGGGVAGAGDMNADGLPELVVASVVGFALGEMHVTIYPGASAGYVDLDGAVEVSHDHPAGQAPNYGVSVTSLGDANGDGYADLAIDSPMSNVDFNREGTVDLVLGGPGLVASKRTLFGPAPEDLGLFGMRPAAMGDVNGDRMADLVIGMSPGDTPPERQGWAHVYLSTDAGIPDEQTFRLEHPMPQPGRFGYAAHGVGDVNDDGVPDVAVGAPMDDSNQGAVYLMSGDWLAGPAALRIPHPSPGGLGDERFGMTLGGPSDVDGDGLNDLVVAAYLTPGGLVQRGALFVFLEGLTRVVRIDNPTGVDRTRFGETLARAPMR